MFYYKKGGTYTASPTEIPGGEAVTREEYERVRTILRQRPVPPEGYGYRLTGELTWELYELPPVEELTAEEALEILMGGAV